MTNEPLTQELFAERLSKLIAEHCEELGLTGSGFPNTSIREGRTIIKCGNLDRDWFYVDVEKTSVGSETKDRTDEQVRESVLNFLRVDACYTFAKLPDICQAVGFGRYEVLKALEKLIEENKVVGLLAATITGFEIYKAIA